MRLLLVCFLVAACGGKSETTPDAGQETAGDLCIPGGAGCVPATCDQGFYAPACTTDADCDPAATCLALDVVQDAPTTVAFCMRRCTTDDDCAAPGVMQCDVGFHVCTDYQGEFLSALGTTGGHAADGSACAGSAPVGPTAPFGPSVRADDSQTTQASEVSLVIAKDEQTIFVAYNEAGGRSAGYSELGVSTNRGATWSPIPVADPMNYGDPALAIDPRDDHLYCAYIGGSFACAPGYTFAADNAIMLISSTDEGATWTAPVPVNVGAFLPRADHFLDKPLAVVGPEGNVYVTYADYSVVLAPVQPAHIMLARSTDGGQTWTDFQVDQGLRDRGRDYAQPVVDDAGDLWVVWSEDVPGGGIAPHRFGSVVAARSTDHGATFGAPVVVTTTATQWPASIAVAHDGSAVYVAYESWTGTVDVGDIYVAVSTDGGKTFAPAVKANDDTTCATHWQPTIAVDSNGDPWVAWQDNRHGDQRVMIAHGHRTGSTLAFDANTQVNDAASPDFNTGRGPANITDYLTLAIRGQTIACGFADLRTLAPPASYAHVFVAAGTLP